VTGEMAEIGTKTRLIGDHRLSYTEWALFAWAETPTFHEKQTRHYHYAARLSDPVVT